jgi:hypothetical protein
LTKNHYFLLLDWLFVTTRRSNTDPLLPWIDNPEAIIKAGNVEKRRREKIATQLTEKAIHVPLPNSPPLSISGLPGPSLPDDQQHTTPSTIVTRQLPQPAPTANQPSTSSSFVYYQERQDSTDSTDKTMSSSKTNDPGTGNQDMSTRDCIRALMALQQSTILQLQTAQAQAQSNREANAVCIARLEEIAINSSVKTETTPPPSQISEGRIDLQRFKISDGPVFQGPFQAVEPFLRWLHGLQIFFTSKAVEHPDDKIRILGGLLAETNLLSFYANKANKYIGKPWTDFKTRLLTFALPPEWRTDLKKKI